MQRFFPPKKGLMTEIQQVSVNDLIPYANNSRTHSTEQVAKIAASIREFGFTNPVLIDGEGGIIAGHGRVQAARKLGLDEVPCIMLDHLTDTQKKAYIIADNKLALNAGRDDELLKIELQDLHAQDFDMGLLGFDAQELSEAMGYEDELCESASTGDQEKYTQKITPPIYEIKGENPPVAELFDNTKTGSLCERIRKVDMPDDVRGFMMAAATRHTVFNYQKIAEFYAHADHDVQELMEQSALVIIDFDKAIEEGYIKLTKRVMQLSLKSDGVDDE